MTIRRTFLTCFIAYVLIAILSFVYLKWWMAILVCFAVFALFVLGVRVAIQLFVRKLGQSVGGVFEQRGAILRGAVVEVHSIEPVPPPSAEESDETPKQLEGDVEPDDDDAGDDGDGEDDADGEEEDSDEEKVFYRVDVSIRVPPPALPPAGADDVQRARVVAASGWHPNELVLVDADAPPDPPVDASNFPAMIQMMQQFTRGYRPREITEPDAAPTAGEGMERDDVIEGPRSRRFSFVVGVPPSVRALTFRYYTESFARIVLPPAP